MSLIQEFEERLKEEKEERETGIDQSLSIDTNKLSLINIIIWFIAIVVFILMATLVKISS